jgi:hypothetical protein
MYVCYCYIVGFSEVSSALRIIQLLRMCPKHDPTQCYVVTFALIPLEPSVQHVKQEGGMGCHYYSLQNQKLENPSCHVMLGDNCPTSCVA